MEDVAFYGDSKLPTACVSFVERHLNAAPWKSGPNSSALIVVLSDIFKEIRNAEAQKDDQDKDAVWCAPDSFERKTVKYWVEEDQLTNLLLAAVSEAPLLVYGHSGRLTDKADRILTRSEGDKIWGSMASRISSVYFDSPDMCMYKERIGRPEGAQLLRARWYGSKPIREEPIFLELKTHHEKWINTKSVKERVSIQEGDMVEFLSDDKWTREDAQGIVLAASPTLCGDAMNKATDLLLTMKALVLKHNLRPCVRSSYLRAAFQSPTSNSLRLTIDRNVSLIDEASAATEGSWCLPDDAAIDSSMVARVPYAVFEVKLADSDVPRFIRELEVSNTIIEAVKFSKFLTGAAAFNAKKIDVLPYWVANSSFKPLFQQESAVPDISERPRRRTSAVDESPASIAATAKSSSALTLKRLSTVFGSMSSRPDRGPAIAPYKSARVEPKSYFANERTFIQWISAGLLLVTISVLLLDFSEDDDNYILTTGIVLCFGALFVVVYATFVYFRRIQLLSSGKPYGYVDKFGPIILACAVFTGVVVLLVFLLNQAAGEPTFATVTTLRAESGYCYQYPMKGASTLEYQPSDVLVDNERDLLLIPSLQSIIGLSKTDPNSPVRHLVDIPDADLEALCYAGDRIFAISEDLSLSELIELEWDSDKLRVINRWVLPTAPAAEGITSIPDLGGGDGPVSLYVGANVDATGESMGRIIVYDIPAKNSTITENENPVVLRSRGKLNSKTFNQGLKKSKISALQYFEGLLYVLHDNEVIVRAWDLEKGQLVAETKLPRVASGFEKEWEGFALERRTNTSGNLGGSLKGSKSSLIMHLALDSPAQVWAFAVEEGETRGSLALPDCAAAS